MPTKILKKPKKKSTLQLRLNGNTREVKATFDAFCQRSPDSATLTIGPMIVCGWWQNFRTKKKGKRLVLTFKVKRIIVKTNEELAAK